MTRSTIAKYLELVKWIQKEPLILEERGDRGARIFKLGLSEFVVDLSAGMKAEEFRCPRCASVMTPRGFTALFSILDAKCVHVDGARYGCLEILCGECQSRISLILELVRQSANTPNWSSHFWSRADEEFMKSKRTHADSRAAVQENEILTAINQLNRKVELILKLRQGTRRTRRPSYETSKIGSHE